MNIYIKYLIFIINLYILFSIIEYLVHKYLMHSKMNTKMNTEIATNHNIHHKYTKNDMNLNYSNIYNKNKNKYLGLYFLWKETFFVLLFGLTIAFILNIFYQLNPLFIIIITILFAYYQSSLWNTIHPDIHHIDYKLKLNEGIPPLEIYKKLPYYDWLKANHMKHHIYKNEKKGNYNVTLPLADYLFFSYN